MPGLFDLTPAILGGLPAGGAPAPASAAPAPAQPFNPLDISWNFANDGSGLTQQANINAPTYTDPWTTVGGMKIANGQYDPALAETLNAGGAGNMQYGIAAFLAPSSNNTFGGRGQTADGGATYSTADMQQLGKDMGIDLSSANGDPMAMQGILNTQLGKYSSISGMSEGWNPTGDVRGANDVLYESENGKLVPIQQGANYSAPTDGGFLADHYGITFPLAVIGGGLAYGAMAGAGAGAAGGAEAASTGAGAGGGGTGLTGAGASGAGSAGASTSISQAVANSLGFGSQWASLPAWEQASLTGGLTGGAKAGLTGGNIIEGAALGALGGGVGSAAASGLTGLGLGSAISGIGGKLAGGLASMVGGAALGGANGGSGGGSTGSSGASLPGLLGALGSRSAGASSGANNLAGRTRVTPVGTESQQAQAAFNAAMNKPGLAGGYVDPIAQIKQSLGIA